MANNGYILDATMLKPQGLGYLVPKHWHDRGTNYGTDEMVSMIERSGEHLAALYPGTVLVIGDISKNGGGKLPNHSSHQSGRDVDIGYLQIKESGKLMGPQNRFAGFGSSGYAERTQGYFDLARNWELVRYVVVASGVEVKYIFVSEQVREWLLSYADAISATPAEVKKVEKVLRVERGHNDHLHVRITCSPEDNAAGVCSDWKPAKNRCPG